MGVMDPKHKRRMAHSLEWHKQKEENTMNTKSRLVHLCIIGNFAVAVALAGWFAFYPAVRVALDLRDPALKGGDVPKAAFRLHQALAPKLERWAKARVASGRAAGLSTENISGTEWPVFGSVFYLWSTEALQQAWEKSPTGPVPPKVYARGAVDTLTALVLDPSHGGWVRKHWGERYLDRENVWYRAMQLCAVMSQHNLTGETKYLPLLRERTDALAAEIDASPHGLLNDYPHECYPGDVLAAIACIRRVDLLLGTDHGAMLARAQRGFTGHSADATGLPGYMADTASGELLGPARGCSNSYLCFVAPELWPDLAGEWYGAYERQFWQYRWGAWGFREFAKDSGVGDWYADVDAGPSIAGHGMAACAFGLAAARANARFDHAYPLAAEMLAMSWPLPNGRLGLPQLLSNATDAPYLGEEGILFNMTRPPAPSMTPKHGGAVPTMVYALLAAYVLAGILIVTASAFAMRRALRLHIPYPQTQVVLWMVLVVVGALLFLLGQNSLGYLCLAVSMVLPRATTLRGEE
jgi:hypothetical protein